MKWTKLGVLIASCAMAQGLRADEVQTTLSTDAQALLSVEVLGELAANEEMSNPAPLMDPTVLDDGLTTPPDTSITLRFGDGYGMHRGSDGRWYDGLHYYRSGHRYYRNGAWLWFFSGFWYSTPRYGGSRHIACFARNGAGVQFRASAPGYSANFLQRRAVEKCRSYSPRPASCRALGCR